jgi:hypothetical protein
MARKNRLYGGMLVDENETVETLQAKIDAKQQEIWALACCRDAMREERSREFQAQIDKVRGKV